MGPDTEEIAQRHWQKRHPPAGSRPGTLVISAEAHEPRLKLFVYDEESIEEFDEVDLGKLPELIDGARKFWLDVQGLGDEALLRRLGEMFSIHPLALEDVVNAPQRPKTEIYEMQQYVIVRMARLDDEGVLDLEQISLFFTRNCVVTFQERYGDVLDPVRNRLRRGGGPIRQLGSDYLAYALIDTVVDGYYPVLEEMGDEIEVLEDRILDNPRPDDVADINDLKRRLLRLRRSLWPMRDAVGTMIRDESPFVTGDIRMYLRDVYDHTIQLADVLESYRELVSGLMSVYLSAVSNRTNEVMKVLTIMASLFIPLTFLAGIYGMNFAFMPELEKPWAYPLLLGLMTLIAIAMLLWFRRKGWIGWGR